MVASRSDPSDHATSLCFTPGPSLLVLTSHGGLLKFNVDTGALTSKVCVASHTPHHFIYTAAQPLPSCPSHHQPLMPLTPLTTRAPPATDHSCSSHHQCPSHCMPAAGAPPAQHHVLLCVHCPEWCTLADVRRQLHQGLGLQLRETPHTSGMPQTTVAVQNSSCSHISFNRCTLATLVRWPRYSLLAKCVSPWQSPSASGCTMEAVL